MSRSGYSDESDNPQLWRGAVDRALRGYRGQHFLRKLLDALDALPVKRLIAHEIVNEAGDVCALGAVDPACSIDPEDSHAVAQHFGIAPAMAAEIVYMNDESQDWLRMDETSEQRWLRMRAWVEEQIVPYEDEDPPAVPRRGEGV